MSSRQHSHNPPQQTSSQQQQQQQFQNQPLLSSNSLRALLASVAENETMDPLVESALVRMADEFTADVCKAAVELAAHRRSQVIQPKDVLFVLANDYNIDIPGGAWSEDQQSNEPDGNQHQRRKSTRTTASGQPELDVHAARMAKLRQTLFSKQHMQSLNDNNDDEQPGIIDSMITSVNSYVSWLFRDTIEVTPESQPQSQSQSNPLSPKLPSPALPPLERPRKSINLSNQTSPGASAVKLTEIDFGISLIDRNCPKEECLLTQEMISYLHAAIPPKWRLCSQWKLLYATSTDGYSLGTLYRATRYFEGAVILVIKEHGSNALFGCFATEAFQPHQRHFGTGECFLFTANCQDMQCDIIKYGATGKNDYYLYAEQDYIAVGCGDGKFGLWIDASLSKGTSQPVATFDNRRLSMHEPISIQSVELWGIVYRK